MFGRRRQTIRVIKSRRTTKIERWSMSEAHLLRNGTVLELAPPLVALRPTGCRIVLNFSVSILRKPGNSYVAITMKGAICKF